MINEELTDLELELQFFEPITRVRSNTWPLPRPEGYVETNPSIDTIIENLDEKSLALLPEENPTTNSECSSSNKKPSTRNAHGTASYAELITQAISSAKDQRLTLSEIYSWMIENVPTIKDRETSNGWRNSVRHNLSLHKCFVRVPNESTGKSSWWMINPNEIVGKSTRRRSSSMEAKKYQRSRSRAKKNAQRVSNEALTIGTANDECQMQRLFYHQDVERLSPIPAVSTETEYYHASETFPGTSSANSVFLPSQGTTTSSFIFIPETQPLNVQSTEAEYYYSPETAFGTLDNHSPLVPCQGISSVMVIAAPQPSTEDEQTLTKFNSFLDDVTDVISRI